MIRSMMMMMIMVTICYKIYKIDQLISILHEESFKEFWAFRHMSGSLKWILLYGCWSSTSVNSVVSIIRFLLCCDIMVSLSLGSADLRVCEHFRLPFVCGPLFSPSLVLYMALPSLRHSQVGYWILDLLATFSRIACSNFSWLGS